MCNLFGDLWRGIVQVRAGFQSFGRSKVIIGQKNKYSHVLKNKKGISKLPLRWHHD